jgi:hypothetical protein
MPPTTGGYNLYAKFLLLPWTQPGVHTMFSFACDRGCGSGVWLRGGGEDA